MPFPAQIPRQETGVSGGKAKITPTMLRLLAELDREEFEVAGGLDGLARLVNVPAAALRHYLRKDGRLTPIGENMLYPDCHGGITNTLIRRWARLGPERIEAAGGLDGLAKQDNVPAAMVRSYLREDGSLTRRGKDHLNLRSQAEITNTMLRQWTYLGPDGLEDVGGLDGLATLTNVSETELRSCLREDGRLTRHGEERLYLRSRAEITNAMLQKWVTLGPAGIEAAGGLSGLARRADVPPWAIRHYLREDGSLTRHGEKRLRAADARPV
ncbi:hypothetical protein [Pandoraea pulmonicola]|uniref:MerR family regulatory protein n=1 Tax=Pandoraea pulmonicola TaxID=93221 RepID=A0AAJ4ZA92_PANPU|nr:hypothetical protein [Pandoraea pulmonicola]AJC21551.1 hypothetical protein RO07_15560 [Pandoraea pulmonicola]SUA89649.1 MerR family regulatory protein [Pandoraea pulmonicola]